MSEAERMLLSTVWQAIWDSATLLDLDDPLNMHDVDVLTDAVVGRLKKQDWLITEGKARSVQWFDWQDSKDDYEVWRVDTDNPEAPEEEEAAAIAV